MRALIFLALLAASAQDRQTTTYVYSLDGRKEAVSRARTSDGRTVEEISGLNGRPQVLESSEEKTLEESATRKVVERTVRRDGALAERVRVETDTQADGTVISRTTVSRGELNGRMVPAERIVSETRPSGQESISATRVERRGLDGAFELVEKREGRKRELSGGASESSETVYRRDPSGRFTEAVRQVQRQSKEGESVIEQTEEYEAASTGRMQLSKQTLARSTKSVTGESRVVDVYGPAAPGRPVEGGLQLRERQVIERREEAAGHTETFSIQRPSLSSPRELGPLVKISETVCRGKCN